MSSAAERAKRQVAAAAVDWIERQWLEQQPGMPTLGIGSGTTVACLIEELAQRPALLSRIRGFVPASEVSRAQLLQLDMPVVEPCRSPHLGLYLDGADQIDPQLRMIKGGGGALTREKLLAVSADLFVCMCDASKTVSRLSGHSLPLEVLPVALERVIGQLRSGWGEPVLREDFVTDNGNRILDIRKARLPEPLQAAELQLCAMPGVLDCGLFARRRADLLLVADAKTGEVRQRSLN